MGKKRYSSILIALPCLLSAAMGASASEERGPECNWDLAEQRFADDGALAWVGVAGSGMAHTLIIGDDDDINWHLLHHCATGNYLLMKTSEANSERVGERLLYLIESENQYTMEEVAVDLAGIGAGVRRGNGDIGRCDCQFLEKIGL